MSWVFIIALAEFILLLRPCKGQTKFNPSSLGTIIAQKLARRKILEIFGYQNIY